jgi:acyl transferase domain-containing protein/acyl carrier protein
MEPILEEFRAFAAGISYRAPALRMINNVTGEAVAADKVLDAEYWTGHIRRPVQFARGIEALQGFGCDVLLEIGPHPVLVGMGQACWSADETLLWVGSLRRGRPDEEQLLDAAAAMYAFGVEIDFAAMDAPWSSARRKVVLPTYPFQRRRYWVEAPEAVPATPETRVKDCLYGVVWEQRDAKPRPAESIRPETWLLLADETGVAAALRQELQQTGRRCVWLTADEHRAAPLRALEEKIAAASSDASAPLTHVVHLCSLDRPQAEDAERLWEAQGHGVESALDLVRTLIDRHWQGRLWLVTSGVQRVLDSDGADATQSPVWGLGKSIGMEHPELWGGLIDLQRNGPAPAADLLAALEGDDADDQVALRDGRRRVARLARQEASEGPRPIAVDPDGTYLITGGLGGIGLEVARRLARRGVRHLVLNGRRAPSDAARNAIAELERDGCEFKVVLADVSREADVARLLDEIHDSNFPHLRGIVHAAGVDALVPLSDLDHKALRKTMAAKVAGGFLLDKLTTQRGMELSLFVCTSSISSVWGGVQQAAYSAANAYLDALAEQRRTRGQTANTVNFGPWTRVGMGTLNEDGIAWLRSRGIRALEPEFALDGMETAIAVGRSGTAVADVAWPKLLELVELQRPRPLFAKLGRVGDEDGEETRAPAASALIAQLAEAAPAGRVELLQKIVKAELARVLQRPEEELGSDVGFFDMGMDSLMAVEFRNALTKQLGRKLPATMVMDSPDVDSTVSYILKRVLGLDGGKTVRQPRKPAAEVPEIDTTESEVGRLSASEVASALESELQDILGA